MSNNYGENTDVNTSSSTASGDGDYSSVEPNTVDNDKELQDAMNGEDTASQDDTELDLDSTEWGGMQSGVAENESTQNSNWLAGVPEGYRSQASAWANQQGMLKITPKLQRQKFTYSTVAYIANNNKEPKVQVFPISDVNVIPHQISFDFYDTTEGRVGVSNATEKHMEVTCDVYLTDLIYEYWNHGEDGQNDFSRMSWSNKMKNLFWEAINSGEDYNKALSSYTEIESTKEFADFRNTFLQQHTGWVCMFSSHTFGVFQGVLTNISYSVTSGETFAKWSLEFKEAIFIQDEEGNGYSTTGVKQSASEEGDGTESGDAQNTE